MMLRATISAAAQKSRKYGVEWEVDGNVFNCYCCGTHFSLLTRRHHCRLCGHIICSSCSMRMKIARSSFKKRVCNDCLSVPLPDTLLSSPDAGVTKLLASKLTFNKIPSGLFSPHTAPFSFDVLGRIGSGAFGLVLRVRHKLDGKEYALKVMNKRVLERKLGAADSALSERHALRRLHTHPFIVQFHCAFQTPANLYLVLELCTGGTLSKMLHRTTVRGDRMPDEQVAHYAAQLALAIQYIHSKGYIFRDLKLSNVLLTAEGDVRLTDFGLAAADDEYGGDSSEEEEESETEETLTSTTTGGAKSPTTAGAVPASVRDSAKPTTPPAAARRGRAGTKSEGAVGARSEGGEGAAVTTRNTVCGTRGYMSPELVRRKGYDQRVDWWSFGCCMLLLLCGTAVGRPLVAGVDAGQRLDLPATVSGPGKDLVLRLLQKHPSKRLGAQGAAQVLAHPFFAKVDLEAMRNGCCTIPLPVVAAQRRQQREQQQQETSSKGTGLETDAGAEMPGVKMQVPRDVKMRRVYGFDYFPAPAVPRSQSTAAYRRSTLRHTCPARPGADSSTERLSFGDIDEHGVDEGEEKEE